MSLVSYIKNNFTDAIIDRCSEMGCKLRLNDLSNCAVLKGEKICKNRKICDCIIFKENGNIVIGIIELKSKTIHTTDLVEKLTNGTEMALIVLEKCRDINTINFYHVVLHQGIHTSEYKMITAKEIKVRGKRYPIILKRCGESFSKLISDFG